MKRTPLCELLGIDYPIIQAGMASFTSADLVAAVSNAGGMGTLGATTGSLDDLKNQIARIRELTKKPFALNFGLQGLADERFALALEARPALISFTLGDPGDRVKRAHDAGIPVMIQCTSAAHARQAVSVGADAIVAQGGESGGFAGIVSTMALVPQVVGAAGFKPVVAAGGIADGRGLAAALVLGAQGVNMGTRFLASREAPISEQWKRDISVAESEDAVKFEVWNDIFPSEAGKFLTIPRVLESPFVKEWMNRHEDAGREGERLRKEIGTAIEEGRWGDLTPFTGQSAGLVREILPAGEIVRRIMIEAEEALKATARLLD